MGLPSAKDPLRCRSCDLAKGVRSQHKEGPQIVTDHLLQLVHTDVCGPIEPDMEGHRFFVTFTDDFSRFSYVYRLKNKSEVFEKFVDYQTAVEKILLKQRAEIQEIRCDNAGEYFSKEFVTYAAKKGIRISPTAPYNPESNGLAERLNRTLNDKARAMLVWARLPNVYWGFALQAALSRSKILRMTPHERWTGKKPWLEDLRVWGCTVSHCTDSGML